MLKTILLAVLPLRRGFVAITIRRLLRSLILVAGVSAWVPANASIMFGTFHLRATDPGSVAVTPDFTGTFTFDGSAINPANLSTYLIPLISATISGGDSDYGCCYVGDPYRLQTIHLVPSGLPGTYVVNATPTLPAIKFYGAAVLGMNVWFQNDTLNTQIVLVGPNEGIPATDPNYGLHWTEGVYLQPNVNIQTGFRGGVFSISDPIPVPVPEPETYMLMLVGLGLLGVALRRTTGMEVGHGFPDSLPAYAPYQARET